MVNGKGNTRQNRARQAGDTTAETDMNVIMNEKGEFIEVQGTAEGHPFSREELLTMLDYAEKGITDLIEHQNVALKS